MIRWWRKRSRRESWEDNVRQIREALAQRPYTTQELIDYMEGLRLGFAHAERLRKLFAQEEAAFRKKHRLKPHVKLTPEQAFSIGFAAAFREHGDNAAAALNALRNPPKDQAA